MPNPTLLCIFLRVYILYMLLLLLSLSIIHCQMGHVQLSCLCNDKTILFYSILMTFYLHLQSMQSDLWSYRATRGDGTQQSWKRSTQAGDETCWKWYPGHGTRTTRRQSRKKRRDVQRGEMRGEYWRCCHRNKGGSTDVIRDKEPGDKRRPRKTEHLPLSLNT